MPGVSTASARHSAVNLTCLKRNNKNQFVEVGRKLIAVGVSCVVYAQQEKKPLTNADVVKMVKAGLAESVIITTIQSSPAGYDTSPTGLIDLQSQGAEFGW